MAIYSLLKASLVSPLITFFKDSRSIGIVLLISTILSILLSNFPLSNEWYNHFWVENIDHTGNHYWSIGIVSLPNSPLYFINDFFMSFFFLLAGMEIKRELLTGELASIKQSILPVGAAIGGMIIPAVIYWLICYNSTDIKGWAIPMATDIAFTLGVASLLGKKVPTGLKVFITALAIIDDLGAILIIALFYGSHIELIYLLFAFIIIVALYGLNYLKIPFGWYYWIMGILLWYFVYHSGVHATIAGVIFAFTIPSKSLNNLELRLHYPVYFIIMPLFVLSNTALIFPPNMLNIFSNKYTWGIIAGLFIGKPLGICTAVYVMIKKKWSGLPSDSSWYSMIGISILAGIGFTMSIFISTLAFGDKIQQDVAKMAVLVASFLSMTIGYLWFVFPKSSKMIENVEA